MFPFCVTASYTRSNCKSLMGGICNWLSCWTGHVKMWQADRPISMQVTCGPEVNLPGRALLWASCLMKKGASTLLLLELLELLVFPGLMEHSYAFWGFSELWFTVYITCVFIWNLYTNIDAPYPEVSWQVLKNKLYEMHAYMHKNLVNSMHTRVGRKL